jgi:hypothetical protein
LIHDHAISHDFVRPERAANESPFMTATRDRHHRANERAAMTIGRERGGVGL